ncbi:MAG: HAD family phosphatase [Coriobacteriia bacterium]|nr:HAD family phosphatase [Coriobacteriia bacterium]
MDAESASRESINPIHAVCFDYDGTLIDSESFYFETMRDWLLDHFGVLITKSEYAYYETVLDDEIITWLLENDRLESHTPADEPRIRGAIMDEWLVHWDTLMESEHARMNAQRLHDFKSHTPLPLALVTCSYPPYVDPFIDAYGLDEVFSYILTGDLVERLKPDPEIYLMALEKFALEGREVVTVEDAPRGISSALKAGIRVVRPLAYVLEHEPMSDTIEVPDLEGALNYVCGGNGNAIY